MDNDLNVIETILMVKQFIRMMENNHIKIFIRGEFS